MVGVQADETSRDVMIIHSISGLGKDNPGDFIAFEEAT
jgi:hypothetical protein